MKLLPARTKIHLLAALFCLSSFNAFAETAKAPAYDKVSDFFGAGMRGAGTNPQGLSKDVYVTGISSYMRQNGMETGQLTKQDIEKLRKRALAYLRMKRVSLILVADLNGDGSVTKDEVAEYLNLPGSFIFVDDPRFISPLLQSTQPPTPYDYVMQRMDKNKDGKVSFDEMRYIPDEEEAFKGKDADAVRLRFLKDLLAQDPNSDYKLTIAELETLAGQAFNIVDLNKDGVLNKDELDAYIKALNPAPAVKPKS